nr:hypothetical protein [Paenibacillus sp. N3.4]
MKKLIENKNGSVLFGALPFFTKGERGLGEAVFEKVDKMTRIIDTYTRGDLRYGQIRIFQPLLGVSHTYLNQKFMRRITGILFKSFSQMKLADRMLICKLIERDGLLKS